MESRVEIAPVEPTAYREAAALLLPGAADRVTRFILALRAGEIDPRGLFVAHRHGEILAAALVQVQPGAMAVVWPPTSTDPAIAGPLVTAIASHLTQLRIKQAQVICDPSQQDRAQLLESIGFRQVTELITLVRDVARWEQPPHPGYRFTDVSADDPLFATTLLASYEGSLDCPELNGVRSPDEVMAGYAQIGPGTQRKLMWIAGEPVGVAIVTEEGTSAEVIYLGLRPEVRGRGAGRELLRGVIRTVSEQGHTRLSLSVDARNAPALYLYSSQHFRSIDRQLVYLGTPPIPSENPLPSTE